MINDIIIIDDVISKSYQELLAKDIMLMSPWNYVEDVAHSQVEIERLNSLGQTVYNSPGFACGYYNNRQGLLSPLWYLLKPVLWEACEKIDLLPKEVITCRAFMTMPDPTAVREWDNPHVDFNFPHWVCLYYVNDSDGDTVFFNSNSKETPMGSLRTEDIEVVKRITPLRGRVVLFDGTHYHSSTRGTSGTRCVINYCWV